MDLDVLQVSMCRDAPWGKIITNPCTCWAGVCTFYSRFIQTAQICCVTGLCTGHTFMFVITQKYIGLTH